MSQYIHLPIRYRKFSQTNNVTVTGLTPITIIGTGIGNKSIVSTSLRVGSTIIITQTGIMSSSVGTTGTPTLKINNTTAFGTSGSLPNNLTNAGLFAQWIFTVKSISETEIIFQSAVRSTINAVTFQSSYNRVTCIPVTVPISTNNYTFDILYNFNDLNGSITIGQTIFEVEY